MLRAVSRPRGPHGIYTVISCTEYLHRHLPIRSCRGDLAALESLITSERGAGGNQSSLEPTPRGMTGARVVLVLRGNRVFTGWHVLRQAVWLRRDTARQPCLHSRLALGHGTTPAIGCAANGSRQNAGATAASCASMRLAG